MEKFEINTKNYLIEKAQSNLDAIISNLTLLREEKNNKIEDKFQLSKSLIIVLPD